MNTAARVASPQRRGVPYLASGTGGGSGSDGTAARRRGVVARQRAELPPQRCIVVVEDDPDISELLTSVFDAEGYRAVPARDADSALQLALSSHPDAITLDLGLPDRDGHQLLHELKGEDRTRDIPVIVVSAYSGRLCPEDHKLVAAVIDKPFDLGELLRVTRQTLATDCHSET